MIEKTYDILEEFVPAETKPGKTEFWITRLDFIFEIYIIGLLVYKYYYLKSPFDENTIYQVSFLIAAPLLLWFIFIKGFKAGWFLRAFYYSMFVIALGIKILGSELDNTGRITTLVVIGISAAIIATSFHRKILNRLKIGWILITTYALSAILLIFFFIKFVP